MIPPGHRHTYEFRYVMEGMEPNGVLVYRGKLVQRDEEQLVCCKCDHIWAEKPPIPASLMCYGHRE